MAASLTAVYLESTQGHPGRAHYRFFRIWVRRLTRLAVVFRFIHTNDLADDNLDSIGDLCFDVFPINKSMVFVLINK